MSPLFRSAHTRREPQLGSSLVWFEVERGVHPNSRTHLAVFTVGGETYEYRMVVLGHCDIKIR